MRLVLCDCPMRTACKQRTPHPCCLASQARPAPPQQAALQDAVQIAGQVVAGSGNCPQRMCGLHVPQMRSSILGVHCTCSSRRLTESGATHHQAHLLEQVAHARGAHAHKDLHKLRCSAAEEGHAGLACRRNIRRTPTSCDALIGGQRRALRVRCRVDGTSRLSCGARTQRPVFLEPAWT